jgi:hypothetical protein
MILNDMLLPLGDRPGAGLSAGRLCIGRGRAMFGLC